MTSSCVFAANELLWSFYPNYQLSYNLQGHMYRNYLIQKPTQRLPRKLFCIRTVLDIVNVNSSFIYSQIRCRFWVYRGFHVWFPIWSGCFVEDVKLIQSRFGCTGLGVFLPMHLECTIKSTGCNIYPQSLPYLFGRSSFGNINTVLFCIILEITLQINIKQHYMRIK